MARSRSSEKEFDDIELLNIHRYPESYPAGVVASVRNSRVYQKRLEDLLRGLPDRRRVRETSFFEPKATDPETKSSKQEESAATDPVSKFIKKIFPWKK